MEEDIRWRQRLANYRKALQKLNKAVEVMSTTLDMGKDVDELLREGLIQRFEYTHELAWNVMKDYAEYQGYTDVRGSRSAIRMAFEMNLITDKAWMDTIGDRNLTSHNYDEETAEDIYESIVNIYHPLFCDFERKMAQIEEEEQ